MVEEQDEQIITPKRERLVDFYGDQVLVAQGEGEQLYVPLRALSDNLGLKFSAQLARVRRDQVLDAKAILVETHSADGRVRPQICLPLEIVPGWLFGVDTGRVKAELRERLNLYRAECFTVLWNAFKDDVMPASSPTSLTPAEQILQQTEAMYKLALQQVELERQYKVMADYMRGHVQRTNDRLANHDISLTDHEQRLISIELRLDPAANITDAQAAEIALAVKNVAHVMEEHHIAGGGYGKVYSEMYRRYRISSYKNLAQAKYDEVITWLSRWYEEITGEKQ